MPSQMPASVSLGVMLKFGKLIIPKTDIITLTLEEFSVRELYSSIKVAFYSLWGSLDAFNNMITVAHCEGSNNKFKVKTIIYKTMGVCYFTMLLLKVAQNKWPSILPRTGF